MITTSNIDKVLQEGILNALNKYLKARNLFLRIARKAKKGDLHNEKLVVKHQKSLTSGVEMQSGVNGAFPVSGESKYAETIVPLARILGTVGIPLETWIRAKGDGSILKDPLAKEISDMTAFMQKLYDFNFMRGTSGTLCTISAYANGSPSTFTVESTRMLEEGMLFDVYNGSSPVTDAVGLTVTEITGKTTFTATVTGTPEATHTIHIASSYGNAPTGLENIISKTSSLQGQAATPYWWQATVVDNSSLADFNLQTMITHQSNMEERGAENIFGICEGHVYNVMGWLLLPRSTFVNSGKWQAFWDSFKFGDMRIIKHHGCPKNTLFNVDKKGLLYGQLGKEMINVVDVDGTTRRMAINSSGKYLAGMVSHFIGMAQLGCTDRTRMGLYPNIRTMADSGHGYGALGGLQSAP